MSELVCETTGSGAAILRMNAPERLNAISNEMKEGLIESLTRCFLSDECPAIVITGSGGNFSAGGDIRSAWPAPEELAQSLRHRLGRLHELIRLICCAPKPVIACVEGKAFGAGMSLAIACDAVVASPDAQFCAAFGRVGLIPDAGMLYTLPRRVGAARAQHLMLSARTIAGAEALEMGVADRLAPAVELSACALDEARRLSGIAPLAFAAIKSLGNTGPASLEQAFAEELRLQPLLAMTNDNNEARAAFAQRRNPVFRGC